MFKKTMVIQGHLCEALFILINRLSHSLGHSNPLCVRAQLLSHVWLFATPWTVAPQAPLSMGVSRQEYWSGLPFPHPGDLPEYITSVLVWSGCYNQNHMLRDLINRDLPLVVLEAENPKLNVLAHSFPAGLPPGLPSATFLLGLHMVEKSLMCPLIRAHRPYLIRTLPWWPHLTLITTSQALSPNTVTLEVTVLIYEF